MNKVILSGNICKDIEIKYTQNNVAVVQNTIAVKNNYKNANGDYDSQFINFVAWKQTAEFLNNYASKGSKILIEGNIRNRSYEKQDGTKAYITEVIVEKVELNSSNNNRQVEAKPVPEERTKDLRDDIFKEFGEQIEMENKYGIDENDLPF